MENPEIGPQVNGKLACEKNTIKSLSKDVLVNK